MERETNKLSKSIDPYTYAIKVKHQLHDTWLAVGHIIRENHAIAICLWKKVTTYYWTFNVHNFLLAVRGAIAANIFRQKWKNI